MVFNETINDYYCCRRDRSKIHTLLKAFCPLPDNFQMLRALNARARHELPSFLRRRLGERTVRYLYTSTTVVVLGRDVKICFFAPTLKLDSKHSTKGV